MLKSGVVVLSLVLAVGQVQAARTIGISSMAELEAFAAGSGHSVKMKPGVYRMADLLTDEGLERRKTWSAGRAGRIASERREASMLLFSGHNNTFDFTGVTIEVDTRFLSAFKGAYVIELLVTGNGNSFRGLTLRDRGTGPTDKGGVSLAVYGDRNTLRDMTLHVRGSFPYGYGDLLGKGKGSIVRGRKHSGLLICGTDTRLLECKVISRSFGHCFFIQGGVNTYFENCYAEGEMRSTDEMLAEKEGPAFDHAFASVYPPKIIQPGYMKSLQECGFRTYGAGGPAKRKTGKVTLVNCTAKNVRVGFALQAGKEIDPVQLDGCRAVGCERGYYLSRARVRTCSGDAAYGPLLYLSGAEASDVELELLPETSSSTVHAVATISGNGHRVVIAGSRDIKRPIMLGYHPGPAGEISAPINPREAVDIKLLNLTGMPVLISSEARNCEVRSKRVVERNEGVEITISGDER